MKILLYILTPIAAYIIRFLLSIIIPIITSPITMLNFKVQKNPTVYRFRPDMVLQGVIIGFLVVYLTDYLLSLFEPEISYWWIFTTMVWLSHLSIIAWDKTNPAAYEFSLNVSPIFGFILGLLFI
jgi:hypothetical protein